VWLQKVWHPDEPERLAGEQKQSVAVAPFYIDGWALANTISGFTRGQK
jgi:hypothetical protein